jgi:hypothetical protein
LAGQASARSAECSICGAPSDVIYRGSAYCARCALNRQIRDTRDETTPPVRHVNPVPSRPLLDTATGVEQDLRTTFNQKRTDLK